MWRLKLRHPKLDKNRAGMPEKGRGATPPTPTVRQAVGEVQSLELHQYKSAMVLSTILIKNKVFLHYKMVFNEILNHNVYLFVLTLT